VAKANNAHSTNRERRSTICNKERGPKKDLRAPDTSTKTPTLSLFIGRSPQKAKKKEKRGAKQTVNTGTKKKKRETKNLHRLYKEVKLTKPATVFKAILVYCAQGKKGELRKGKRSQNSRATAGKSICRLNNRAGHISHRA